MPNCRKLLDAIKPDIVHAHYATSYGLICALSCSKPYYLSVWGSDVYEFPKKSKLHELVLKFSLARCSYLLSTSRAMMEETRKYSAKEISITPFGVDMALFKPGKTRRSDKFIIGTIKALEAKYGIDTLIQACALIGRQYPYFDYELRIAGKGSQEGNLKKLAFDLGVAKRIVWLGYISQDEVASEWANLDIAVVVSSSESFGVSAVEAQACGAPLIISDIPGLKEACCEGQTALVVQPRSPESLAEGIMRLAQDSNLRFEMSKKGREYVVANYDVDRCFSFVEQLYQRSLPAER